LVAQDLAGMAFVVGFGGWRCDEFEDQRLGLLRCGYAGVGHRC
jgi:hypothetical protein